MSLNVIRCFIFQLSTYRPSSFKHLSHQIPRCNQ